MSFRYLAVLLLLSAICAAQDASSARFKGHVIGETAEEFFAIANHDGLGVSNSWCREVRGQEQTLESAQAHAKKQRDRDRFAQQLILLYAEVDACQPLNDALAGKDATAQAIIASELGTGGQAVFHNGHLVEISLEAVDSYDHVLIDMTKKLGTPSTQQMFSYQNGFGGTFQYPEAEWIVGSLSASIEQRPIEPPAPPWVAVTIWDQRWAVRTKRVEETNRKSSLD